MKRSLNISLLLVGSVTAAGCAREEERLLYRSRADCLADWNAQEDCEEVRESDGIALRGYYHGPGYSSRSTPLRPGTRSLGPHRISRGGFGSFFHSGS